MNITLEDSGDPSKRLHLWCLRQLVLVKKYFKLIRGRFGVYTTTLLQLIRRAFQINNRSFRVGIASLVVISTNPAAYAHSLDYLSDQTSTNLVAINVSAYDDNQNESDHALETEGFIVKPTITQTIKSGSSKHRFALGSALNLYPYGYCTWWVKSQRPDVPNFFGHAKYWLANAKKVNFPTGSEPKRGAIVITTESPWGHVGYVEDVIGDQIFVSDMNLLGWAKMSKRKLPISSPLIQGYIY